ncbi:MAG: cytochrome C oxidase subunit IV family protein [Geminicoccaceae bacterium]|nr:cytochrome C oxidase subunit IV family protein [Geminicoccaceae bacterium]
MIPPYLRKPEISDYITGFLLAIILTALAFAIASLGGIGRTPTIMIISFLAVIQMGVHLRFFLHYSTSRTPIEARIALFLAGLLATIMVGGGMWAMIDLHHRMMP